MTSPTTELVDPEGRPATVSSVRPALILCTATALVALADFLFYRHAPGISVVIFAVALTVAAVTTNEVRAGSEALLAAVVVMAAALLPALENFGLLAALFAAAGAAVLALTAAGWRTRTAGQRVLDVVMMLLSGPFRLVLDLEDARERGIVRHGAIQIAGWVVPLGLGLVFVMLFVQANPVIAWWLGSGTVPEFHFEIARTLFWGVAIVLIWPFLRVRVTGKPATLDLLAAIERQVSPEPPPRRAPAQAGAVHMPLFNRAAIVRSLVLFNALFAVETALDLAYLWGGAALPDGMTYADYAHRGAYPLIVTALMAGGFVVAALQPGSGHARSGVVRTLVLVWIGQNVLLVLSSMLRLYRYVEVYSLTEWRCVAFAWMLLVAAGLVLLVARIVFGRTDRWLVAANAATLIAMLYLCSLVDFPGMIARFDVVHSREVTGTGQPADINYLCGLGPAALPALDSLAGGDPAVARRGQEGYYRWQSPVLTRCLLDLEGRHGAVMADWRAWTFRGWRLKRYLEGSE